MRFLRWFFRQIFPVRHYDLTGINNADLYALLSPGNGIRVRK